MTGGGRYPLVMLTRDDVRRIALDQPEAYEADHHGMPSFRVARKSSARSIRIIRAPC